MVAFLRFLINGISLGSVYAIIALGYTMVYGIAKMLNFAHGDVIMVGAYIAFCVMAYLNLPPALSVLAGVSLRDSISQVRLTAVMICVSAYAVRAPVKTNTAAAAAIQNTANHFSASFIFVSLPVRFIIFI